MKGITMISIFLLSALLVVDHVVAQKYHTACSAVSPSYNAPFDLSLSPTLIVPSVQFPHAGSYYAIQPCGSVSVDHCPYSQGQQQCFSTTTWERISDGLGTTYNTTWTKIDPNDWSQGIVATSRDITSDPDQCDSTGNANWFQVTYYCDQGNDNVVLLTEPSANKTDKCRFAFQVDSSVICQWIYPGFSSTGSSTGQPIIQSSSSSPLSAQCGAVNPTYKAPYDLSLTPTLIVPSVQFPQGGSYYAIQPCGSVNSDVCSYSNGQQQCFSTTTWERISDDLGTAFNTTWTKIDPNDWSAGVVATSWDIASDPDQCDSTGNANWFQVIYYCNQGTDSVVLLTEPSANKTDKCRFAFQVDSSVICNWIYPGFTSSSTGQPSSQSSSIGSSSSTGPYVPPQSSSSSGSIVSSSSPAPSTCSINNPSYNAPFDLSYTMRGGPLGVASVNFPGGNYVIQPCGSVDVSRCPYSAGQQQCFATTTWESVSDGLGSANATTWSPVDPNDWTKGIVSINTDIEYDYDQCVPDPATNMFRVTYFCYQGIDTVTIVQEPNPNKNGPCIFDLRVDSYTVCIWILRSGLPTAVPSWLSSSSGSFHDVVHATSSSFWTGGAAGLLAGVIVTGMLLVAGVYFVFKFIKRRRSFAMTPGCQVELKTISTHHFERLM